MPDTQQRSDKTVPPRLRQDAVPRIDQDDRQMRRAGACRHIARILFVPRGVCDDKAAAWCRKVAVGHIYGDPLLTLGLQSVG